MKARLVNKLKTTADFRLWIVLGAVWLSSAGCGHELPAKGAVKKVPVTGVVTMGGEPVEGADVYFYTEKFTGFGKTNAEGKFRLQQGAAVGLNKVFLSKLEGWNAVPIRSGSKDPIMALNDPGQVDAASMATSTAVEESQPKQLIPPEYTTYTTTTLSLEVPESGVKDAGFKL